jgi:trehalose 2-sulfotransferase
LGNRVAEPKLSVFICGIQRAGTWLLAHLLSSTGVAGRPEEFFDPDEVPRRRSAWEVSTASEYLERVKEAGMTSNGVFAAKLAWNAREGLLFQVRRVTEDYDSSDVASIASVFPTPRFLWLRRDDELAQAVSWAKATQTGQYAAHQPSAHVPEFDFEQIDNLLHLIRVETGVWHRWFSANGIEPLELTYEALCADQIAEVARVLDYLGLEAPRDERIAPPSELTKQADAINDDWIARYRRLVGAG